MFLVIAFSFCLTKYNDSKIYVSAVSAENQDEQSSASLPNNQTEEKTLYTNMETGEELTEIGNRYIKINTNDQEGMLVTTKDLYMEHKIMVMLDNLDEKTYTEQAVSFSSKEFNRNQVSFSYNLNPDTLKFCVTFELLLDNIYVPTIYTTEHAIYIELKKPHELYERVIVVDAGHGGNDIGTASKDKEYVEKDINLKVVLELKKLLDEDSTYKVYYTRLEDKKVYLNPRMNLADDVQADLFLSVHCNGSEYIGAKGTEVLYGSSKNRSGDISSKRFATICMEEVSSALNTNNRGLIKKDDIYIIGNSKVPVALVELGFMSNEEDMTILKDNKNKKNAAKALYNAIHRALEKMDEVES